MTWYTYILLCDLKTYYVGITYDLDKRIHSHSSGYNIATKKFSDIKLLYYEEYPTRAEAERREIQLKKWSIAKKKALIEGNMTLLKQLSKTRSLMNK